MPSEIHALDGGTISAPVSNVAAAQLTHQQPPPAEEGAAPSAEAPARGSEDGKGEKVDTAA